MAGKASLRQVYLAGAAGQRAGMKRDGNEIYNRPGEPEAWQKGWDDQKADTSKRIT